MYIAFSKPQGGLSRAGHASRFLGKCASVGRFARAGEVDESQLVRGGDLTDHRYVQISPDVIFSADVFTPMYLGLPATRPGKRAGQIPADTPGVDPRQIDLWADDVDYMPV